MSNSTLFFIVVVEAIIIIWLFSKLKQYQKFEKLLANHLPNTPESAHSESAKAQVSTAKTVSVDDSREQPDSLTWPEDSTDGVPEENIEEAKRVQWVMARCRYAEFYIEQLDDDYERGQFRQIVDGCVAQSRIISDPFFRDSALRSVILILDHAGWEPYRDSLLTEIKDENIRNKIERELAQNEPS